MIERPTTHAIITAIVTGELDETLDRIALAIESRHIVLNAQALTNERA